MISGTLSRGGKTVQIANGKLNGDQITFNAGGSNLHGPRDGNGIEGTIKAGGNWKASRAAK